ncbi:unnamed protein product [Brassica rapa]|uniref:Uncharacterized protein n=1 Tax=Brassica campestris TaxID=3711 RepID=A0A8D9G0D2_BRACM|nr:unnamed protein product [Brassica rapa]
MQPACAQVSAKSILMGALKPKRVFIHPFTHSSHGCLVCADGQP